MLAGALIYLPAGLPGLTYAADPADLAGLVQRGKIAQPAADRTRMLSEWVQRKGAPAEVVQRGAAVAQKRAQASAGAPPESSPLPALLVEGQVVSDDLALAVYEIQHAENPDWRRLRNQRSPRHRRQ